MMAHSSQSLREDWVKDLGSSGAKAQLGRGDMSDLASTVGSVNWAPSQGDTSDAVSRVCSCDGTLTREQALALCAELLAGFSAAGFQAQLRALPGRPGAHGYVPGRSELALTVQGRVLPRYGFPGTTAGVQAMLDAVAPFLGDTVVSMLVGEIDEKLGLPRQTTATALRTLQSRKPTTPQAAAESADAGSDSAAPETGAKLPPVRLARAEVLALASEVLEGFSARRFQERLGGLPGAQRRGGGAGAPGLAQLALEEVYGKAIPTYGFAATAGGVAAMYAAIAPYVLTGDWMVGHLLESIDDKLGLPRSSTASLCWRP
mmetsp:Transcript_24596/g.69121  ORF Transcript_24596/g.69121 Transcript_24596/m.69121 type:complete len:317 (+) Transcript_24596:117-1067(+)